MMEPVEIDIVLKSNVSEEGAKATTAIEQMAEASIQAREETKKSLELQRSYLAKLQQEYQALQKQLSQMEFPTKEKQKLKEASNALAKEITAEIQGLKYLETEWTKMNKGYSEVQQRMRLTREQMKTLSLAGREQTAEYRQLKNELGELAKAQALITRTQTEMARGNQAWKGLGDAVTAFSGAASAAVGAWTLLGGSQEEQAKIQTRLQSLMAITIGLQQVQNLLLETSTFRIQTVTKAKELWSAWNLRLATSLGVSTAAMKVFTATATLGLSVFIGWAISAYDKWIAKQKELRTEQDQMTKEISSSAGGQLAKYKLLQTQWDKLGDSLKGKTEFVKKNKEAFAQLGVSINSVVEAENFFRDGEKAIVASIYERAKASAAMTLATKKYEEALTKQQEAERRKNNPSWTEKLWDGVQNLFSRPELSKDDWADIQKEMQENNELYRKGEISRAEHNTRLQRMIEDKARAKRREISADKIKDEKKILEGEAEAFATIAAQSYTEVERILSEAGFKPSNNGSNDKSARLYDKANERLAKLSADAEKESQEISLAIMKEGRSKKLKELEVAYNARKALIKQKLKEIEQLEKEAGIDGTKTRNQLTALETSVDDQYNKDVDQVNADYSRLIEGIEKEITLRSATEQEKRLADIDSYYKEQLKKVAEATASQLEYEEIKTRLLEQKAQERARILHETELRKMDSEERIALRQVQFSTKEYNLQVDREEELLQLQLQYSEKRLAKLQDIASAGGDASEAIEEAKQEIRELKDALDQIPEKKLLELANSLKGIFGQLSKVGGEVGAIFNELAGGVDNIMTAFKKSATPLEKVSGAIGGLTQLMSIATETAEQNKKALEAWQASSEQALQIARMQRIELQGYKSSNAWGVENPYARAIAGAKQYAQSMKELNQLAQTLGRGSVQTGTKKVVSGKNVAGGLAGGAAVGAAVGSFIPVIGNVVGAAIGGLLGGIFGASKKKVVPVFQSLAQAYGEIFNKETFELNPRILQDYGKLDDATKRLVDNWDAIQKKAKEAQEEMRNTFKELSSDLGSKLSNALIEGLKNDDLYSALDDFDAKVSEMIHNIVQQMAFAQYFQKYFDELQSRMEDSFKEGGDGTIVDDIIWFSRIYREGIDAYTEEMRKAQEELEKQGFKAPDDVGGRKAVAKGLARADQDSIDEFNGRMTVAVDRLNTLVIYSREARAHEESVRQFHTILMNRVDRIAENSDFLKRLESIDREMYRLAQEGVKLKS